jgi:hypothetical protein
MPPLWDGHTAERILEALLEGTMDEEKGMRDEG